MVWLKKNTASLTMAGAVVGEGTARSPPATTSVRRLSPRSRRHARARDRRPTRPYHQPPWTPIIGNARRRGSQRQGPHAGLVEQVDGLPDGHAVQRGSRSRAALRRDRGQRAALRQLLRAGVDGAAGRGPATQAPSGRQRSRLVVVHQPIGLKPKSFSTSWPCELSTYLMKGSYSQKDYQLVG